MSNNFNTCQWRPSGVYWHGSVSWAIGHAQPKLHLSSARRCSVYLWTSPVTRKRTVWP